MSSLHVGKVKEEYPHYCYYYCAYIRSHGVSGLWVELYEASMFVKTSLLYILGVDPFLSHPVEP